MLNMAHSKLHADLSASILTGSEEIFEFVCQPCSSRQHVEAAGYCEDCSEYLCISCIEYHGQLSTLKKHTVLDRSAMPKSSTSPKIQTTDVITEKCRQHPDKVLEYFCKSHGQICCSVCLTLNHGSCSGKSYIPDVSDDIAKSQEYTTLSTNLERLVNVIMNQQDKINDSSKGNEKNNFKALSDIQTFRKQMNKMLDEMEEAAVRKVVKLHQVNISVVRSASAKCHSLLSEVKTMAEDLEKRAKAGKKNQLFVKVKLFCYRLAEIERQLKKNGECKVMEYAFEQNEKVQQMVSTLSAIWSLSIRHDDTPTKARYVREVNVKSEEDTKECNISGIAVLTKDRMAVTDYNNKAVKLIDLKENKIMSRLYVSSKPFDITEIKPNQVAVALGNERKIAILAVSGVLSINNTIAIEDNLVVGLTYNGLNFITVCQQPGSVDIIDTFGLTLNSFKYDNINRKLFNMPRHIALSCDKNIAYITDIRTHMVTSITLGGQVISVYRHERLKSPVGVTVGKDGTVYVCSSETNTVHQLTPAGDLTQVIFELDQELVRYPEAIAYSDGHSSLYISSFSDAPE